MKTLAIAAACVMISGPVFAQAAMGGAPTWIHAHPVHHAKHNAPAQKSAQDVTMAKRKSSTSVAATKSPSTSGMGQQ